MIQFENSEYIVIIKDDFVEAIIKTAKWWKERLYGDIEEHIIDETLHQMQDESKYIRFAFDPDDDTARELSSCSCFVSIIVAKKNVTIRNKWKKVRISEDSLYVGLNDNPEFIEALTKEYNTKYDSYQFYLPISYKAHLVSKDESMDDFMIVDVDIPFSDIEVCE